jgi:hypothetical protein
METPLVQLEIQNSLFTQAPDLTLPLKAFKGKVSGYNALS